jgi:hypothetical protein
VLPIGTANQWNAEREFLADRRVCLLSRANFKKWSFFSTSSNLSQKSTTHYSLFPFHTQCFFLTARARDQLCQDATIISHDQEYEFINAATNLAESCNPAGLSRLGRLHRRIWTLHFKIVRRPFCPGTFNCHKSGCLQHPLAFFINLR